MIEPKKLLRYHCPDLEKWQAILASDDFHTILSMTLADLHARTSWSAEQNDAMRAFIANLQVILEPPKAMARTPSKTLDYSEPPSIRKLAQPKDKE